MEEEDGGRVGMGRDKRGVGGLQVAIRKGDGFKEEEGFPKRRSCKKRKLVEKVN